MSYWDNMKTPEDEDDEYSWLESESYWEDDSELEYLYNDEDDKECNYKDDD